MIIRHPRVLAALLAGGLVIAGAGASLAANGDCGQPQSNGSMPNAADALTILKEAVGQATTCDPKPCICDVDDNGSINAADALRTLRKAVGQAVTLTCDCGGPVGPACTSAELFTRAGSDLDSGWTGVGHDADIVEGASITFRTLRRCSDNQAACTKDSDCGNADCVATCDCNDDTSCEVTGPTGPKNCLTTLAPCTSNADCATGVACVNVFGPPLPLSSGGTPVCVLTYFDGDLSGTADSATGEAVTTANLRSRVFLGINLAQPCPRCGTLGQQPEVGDTFTCEGGQFPNAACTVEGVSPDFGGTSTDCPPDLSGSISGSGLAIRFREVTTGTTSRTAQLSCANFAVTSHPSKGTGKCTDTSAACTTNADCKRCTGDPTTACTSDAQCTGKGSCSEAPDQPITCGYWCHCGFCNNNGSLPCFDNTDCPEGQQCAVGTGSGNVPNAPQQKPNDCSGDKFICGLGDDEKCANTIQGKCSLQDFRSCSDDSTCMANGAGVCNFELRPCFEPRITRQGTPSPLGSYCEQARTVCTTNGDCGAGDVCIDDSSVAETAALFCVPATSNPAVNSAAGITGPGSVQLSGFIKVCRCGDGKIGCDEQCDDSNTNNGDGCSDLCQNE